MTINPRDKESLIENLQLVDVTVRIAVTQKSWDSLDANERTELNDQLAANIRGVSAQEFGLELDREKLDEGVQVFNHVHTATRRMACEQCQNISRDEAAEYL